jgi:AraC-like DNA-binding protein
VRINNAKQLLRSGYYSVTDVALECGFENVGYFSYTFKQLTGVSPTAFMNA